MSGWDRAPFLFADDIMTDAHKLQRGMAITVLNNIQLLAPVDTGAYRGSTVVSFGSPDYRYTENIGGMSIAFSAINGLTPDALPTVFIQTNSQYAIYLEAGSSRQAPQGVYGLAFDAMVAAYT
ncbi:HK97 gp10 family phage protein [Psychrobacter sp. BI730]|uniref:HK97 gp10 family phage protein n=1 Tax=Psychrobacter sp. BI730 TaxID=2705463 RepID=UPI0015CDDFD1|nr:HK97 gp10 family phage protein [Psychrobacter sp. BI730]NYR09606.1 HK97 gp10 family phage protein [Psychrobacter sp. BI730]